MNQSAGPNRKTPALEVQVLPFPDEFASLYPRPDGFVEYGWPPVQIGYLAEYLKQLACRTIIVESHYIDRDYIDDVALFYSRSLRGYPNYCRRMHFFTAELDANRWRGFVSDANRGRGREAVESLNSSYLGYSVVRPLPGCPIGRTVLRTFSARATEGHARVFSATRAYAAHLCGFELTVRGLAFQQQDQGVSACATTALWCAIHQVAPMEGLKIATPAEITQAASRYFMPGGRALPSEGLTIEQLCEATRAAGLAPLYVPGTSYEVDRGQLLAYLDSGFAPVLALRADKGEGHAVCAVGYKVGEVSPQTDDKLHFRDGASALKGIYIHDDRLGPYAAADILPLTDRDGQRVRTHLRIRWPQKPDEFEQSQVAAIIVPVPPKLRLSAARMRALGLSVAEWAGVTFPEYERVVTLNCRYRSAVEYKSSAYEFSLTDEGVYSLVAETTLSRYVGVIAIDCPAGALFDVLLDTTETSANPAVLACVRRQAMPQNAETQFRQMATILGAQPIW
jgi:hypothetical protein